MKRPKEWPDPPDDRELIELRIEQFNPLYPPVIAEKKSWWEKVKEFFK